MAAQWPKKRRLLGTKVSRLDGPAKSTGKAKYTFDINLPGLLHAVMLRCPHAHARIKSLDTSEAEKVKGFAALHSFAKVGDELYFAGAEVLAIAADTEEHARDAVRAVKITYDELPHAVKEQEALKSKPTTVPAPGKTGNVMRRGGKEDETFPDGVKAAEATHEGTYGMPIIAHHCLESHGMVVQWNDNLTGMTIYSSTQAVTGNAAEMAGYFTRRGVKLAPADIKVICHYMGGGFGSKFRIMATGEACAELARKAKKPVKLMLDRAAEVTTAGNRPSAYGTVKIGGKKDGTVTFFDADTWGSPGVQNAGSTVGPMPYVYPFVQRTNHTVIRLNTGALQAFRAPGHPQSCYFTDCALDDFAAKIGMDPMQVRLKNIPKDDEDARKANPISWNAIRGTTYTRQIELAAKLAGWKDKWHPPGKGKNNKGPLKHGLGMALHTWGGTAQGQPNTTTVIIAADGSVTARSSTQDLGTAQRTVTAIVVAEVLGLEPGDINVEIGESPFGSSTGSGGSTTCPSQAPAALRGAAAARDELFKKIAEGLKAKEEDLEIEKGQVKNKASGTATPWKKACALLGKETVTATGSWTAGQSLKERGISNGGVGGVQVAEVWVDSETGTVRVSQIVAVQDCGLIVNKLACESQVAGGVIMGLNYALFEEVIADQQTGRIVNPDMEFYKLGGINDMPKIIVEMMDMPERGVIGIGEPPTISTHAAIGNAIFNALGVRVPETPFSPQNVLNALAKQGGK